MAKLEELYNVIKRMIKDGRGEANVYFSDGQKHYPIEKILHDEEKDSDVIFSD